MKYVFSGLFVGNFSFTALYLFFPPQKIILSFLNSSKTNRCRIGINKFEVQLFWPLYINQAYISHCLNAFAKTIAAITYSQLHSDIHVHTWSLLLIPVIVQATESSCVIDFTLKTRIGPCAYWWGSIESLESQKVQESIWVETTWLDVKGCCLKPAGCVTGPVLKRHIDIFFISVMWRRKILMEPYLITVHWCHSALFFLLK